MAVAPTLLGRSSASKPNSTLLSSSTRGALADLDPAERAILIAWMRWRSVSSEENQPRGETPWVISTEESLPQAQSWGSQTGILPGMCLRFNGVVKPDVALIRIPQHSPSGALKQEELHPSFPSVPRRLL
ncbi:hypothetical protein P175DRAFT_0528893 [Aspergillus ochraceoroseus IBT 24754]|uniref:Uncharacterized protein n=1 Tax=Aspergillus ochraceoroseus IBT 24754 TaxID=1392256 RepID=A0A2T5MA15_9EURO|nr:uncharacterized protein P175DRAFT_0528893 [Aspergillus ochraceoroseus IBT 24754]PTU25345.1 hypothetical protein P175DRAFT_0528893 [Aspergillus ochraceoroseus IBT 24754]